GPRRDRSGMSGTGPPSPTRSCTESPPAPWLADGGLAIRRPYTRAVERRAALALLVVLGTGAFLVGLELMVTAVALPAIVVDLASWTELRKASWIVNAYLLTSVVVMPLAGRLSDRWGV